MKDKSTKKLLSVALNTLLYLFLIISILGVAMTLSSKKGGDGTAEIFGYQMRIVTSNSMAACEHTDVSDFEIKSIPVRSMVFVQSVPEDAEEANAWYADLKPGDVLTFRYVYTTQVTITHRITEITAKDTGGYIIKLAGDNTNSEDGQLTQEIDTSIPNNTNYVLGKVTGQSRVLGFIISLLKTEVGMVCMIMIPCAIIILIEILKIVRVFNEDKKKTLENQNIELEELRRKIAELERQKNGETTDTVEESKEETE